MRRVQATSSMLLCSFWSVGRGQYENASRMCCAIRTVEVEEETCSACAKEAFHPTNLRLQSKARVQDGPSFAMKIRRMQSTSLGVVLVDHVSFVKTFAGRSHEVLRLGAPWSANPFTEKFDVVGLHVIVPSVSVGGLPRSSISARTRIWTEVNIKPRLFGNEQSRSKGRQTKSLNRNLPQLRKVKT